MKQSEQDNKADIYLETKHNLGKGAFLKLSRN